MSYDLLKKLGAAVGVLVLLWTASELLRGAPESGATDLDLPELVAESLDSVRITGPGGTITLARSGTNWTVNGLDAAYGGIGDLISAVNEGLSLQLAGRNPEMHSRYELDEANARRLTIHQAGDVKVDLLTGKQGRDYQTIYVRHPGGDEVYSVNTRIASFLTRDVDAWRDKVILALDPDSVAQVEVRRGNASYGLVLRDSVWLIGGEEANGAMVRTMLTQFRALNALGFPTDAQRDSVDLNQPDRTVRLLDAQSGVLAEIAFDSTSNGFWARRSGSDVVFRMDRYKVDQITPADSSLRHNTNGAG